jgi:hypothetical protein
MTEQPQPEDELLYNDPIRSYSTAKGYLQSAYLLVTSPGRYQLTDDTTIFLSFHMLCGFAVELYLKSFLASKGFDAKELRSHAVRHNLEKLYELAQDAGLQNDGAEPLIALLNDHHRNFEFRYMKPDSQYQAMHLTQMFSTLSSLDNAVDEAVGASVSRGVAPGGSWSLSGDVALWRLKV